MHNEKIQNIESRTVVWVDNASAVVVLSAVRRLVVSWEGKEPVSPSLLNAVSLDTITKKRQAK